MHFKLSNVDKQDVFNRATKTFLAVFVPLFVAGLSNLQQVFVKNGLTATKAALLSLTVSATAAAITAVWNAFLQARVAAP
jgi:hypothetical protein